MGRRPMGSFINNMEHVSSMMLIVGGSSKEIVPNALAAIILAAIILAAITITSSCARFGPRDLTA